MVLEAFFFKIGGGFVTNLFLLGIYLVLFLVGYKIVTPFFTATPTYKRAMTLCFCVMAWSIVLTLYTFFVTKVGLVTETELALKLGDFGLIVSMLLGAVALVGSFGLWTAHKIWPQHEESGGDAPRDGGGEV